MELVILRSAYNLSSLHLAVTSVCATQYMSRSVSHAGHSSRHSTHKNDTVHAFVSYEHEFAIDKYGTQTVVYQALRQKTQQTHSASKPLSWRHTKKRHFSISSASTSLHPSMQYQCSLVAMRASHLQRVRSTSQTQYEIKLTCELRNSKLAVLASSACWLRLDCRAGQCGGACVVLTC